MSHDTPSTRTGRARADLAAALRADFEEVQEALTAAIDMSEDLATESGGVNGVAGWWRGVAQKLIHERNLLEQKIEEIVATLTVHKPPPAPDASVDEDHLERVRKARSDQAA